MIILGIETSCDETALSLIETTEEQTTTGVVPHFKILGNTLISQIKVHEQYGGVFPMVAKREHALNLTPLLHKILNESSLLKESDSVTEHISPDIREKITTILNKEQDLSTHLLNFLSRNNKPTLDAIAVTSGPGLEPALWVGISFAKALGVAWNIPVVPVNHMEGHIVSSLLHQDSLKKGTPLKSLPLPALALLISGGHTECVLIKNWREYEIVGQTRDDAVGEAFDKVARLLGLPYPGGPEISRLAAIDRTNHPEPVKEYALPRPMIYSKDLDFSFSGIKTAVLYMVKKITDARAPITQEIKEHIAREFEDAATEVLAVKTKKAIEQYGIQSLIVGGGVIANTEIRRALAQVAQEMNVPLLLPEPHLSTDNALMIALAGYFVYASGGGENAEAISASGNLALGAEFHS